MPTVSIVIPVYNGAEWIGHALRSVFSQSFTDFEVIVVDDGSSDDLEQALSPWRSRIVLRRQANAGPASARNTGLRLAGGRYVAFLDADDEWMPDKLALQVAYFERFPQTGLLHTAVLDQRTPAPAAADAEPEPPANVFCPLFHIEFFIRTLTVMAPRSVLQEAGGFDERREIHVEDWDLWLRIAARWPIGYLPRPLALHRRGGHMSTAYEKTHAGQALVIEKHRALCMAACAKHRLNPERCISDRTYVLHSSLGYERFRHGDRRGARRAFARAVALRPWALGTYARYVASFVPERWLAAVRGRTRATEERARAEAPRPLRPPVANRLTIVNDTVYWRTRRRLARAAHRLDDTVTAAHRERKRILFEASSPMSFGLFQPIYRRLRQDPRLEFWFTARGRAWTPQEIYAAVGISDRIVDANRASWMKWDLAINTDFWEMTNLRRRTQRAHLFHGVAGKYGLDAPVGLAREIATFACLMFPNQDRLDRYVDAGLVARDGGAAALVGYPKADALVDGSLDRTHILAALELDPTRPVVMYAPTWSPHSSLNDMGEEIIEGLAGAGYQVIVKLHDRSYDRQARGSGGIDWSRRLDGYHGHPLVRVRQDADATPLLFVSDALVTDHSSIGFEFMLLNRPLVVVDCPELLRHSKISTDKVHRLRAAADVVTGAAEVAAAVSLGLAHPWRHAEARRATADALFYGAGTATRRAVSILYDLLGLAAPAAAEGAGAHAVVEAAS